MRVGGIYYNSDECLVQEDWFSCWVILYKKIKVDLLWLFCCLAGLFCLIFKRLPLASQPISLSLPSLSKVALFGKLRLQSGLNIFKGTLFCAKGHCSGKRTLFCANGPCSGKGTLFWPTYANYLSSFQAKWRKNDFFVADSTRLYILFGDMRITEVIRQEIKKPSIEQLRAPQPAISIFPQCNNTLIWIFVSE